MDTFNQSITLGSGEVISFSTVGNSTGTPLFLIPGLGNHRSILMLFKQFAVQNDLFMINMDRPGSGGSCTPSKDLTSDRLRRVTINAFTLIKHLGIKVPIYIVGHSCGAVYALNLAWALQLQKHSVKHVFLMSPWVSLSNPKTSSFLRKVRYFPKWMIFAGVNAMAGLHTTILKSIEIDDILEDYSQREKELFQTYPDTKDKLHEMICMASNEDKGGEAADAVFSLEKVDRFPGWVRKSLEGVKISTYHGDKDEMVPVEAVLDEFDDVRVVSDGTHHLLFDMSLWRDIVFIIRDEADDGVEISG